MYRSLGRSGLNPPPIPTSLWQTILALLYHGCDLPYGRLKAKDASDIQAALKKSYLALHDCYPPLVER